jgi:hypothetical protein
MHHRAEDFQVRQQATKRLAEIGPQALDALRRAEKERDLETYRRAHTLIDSIRAALRLPTRVNGMEFKLITDEEWVVPAPGNEIAVNLHLEVTNIADRVCRLYLYQDVTFVLQDSTGRNLTGGRGRTRSMAVAKVSPLLAKGESVTKSFQARAVPVGDGAGLGLYWEDAFSTYWTFRVPSWGTYRLGLIYENDKRATDGGEPLWVGRAETALETVVIK